MDCLPGGRQANPKQHKRISLVAGFENFINSEIRAGRYTSASEVVRSALRLLEFEERQKRELIAALEEGEKSPMIDDFNPRSHLQDLHKKHL